MQSDVVIKEWGYRPRWLRPDNDDNLVFYNQLILFRIQ